MKKLWSLLLGTAVPFVLAAVLLLTGLLSFGEKKVEGSGFDTPEEAVLAWGKYLKKGDLDGMSSTFAVESVIENRSLVDYYQYVSYSTTNGSQFYSGSLPDRDSFSASLDVAGLRARHMWNTQMVILYLTLKDTPYEETAAYRYQLFVFPRADEEEIKAFLSALRKLPELSETDVVRVWSAEKLLGSELSERYKTYTEKRSEQYYGADKLKEMVLEIEIESEAYYIGFSVCQYGEKWYIADFSHYLIERLDKSHDTTLPFVVPVSRTAAECR